MTCDDLAAKCKAGDKKACEMYKKKCGKVSIYTFNGKVELRYFDNRPYATLDV